MLADISSVDAIYIVCGRTGMRKSIDGLCAIIQEQFSMEIDHSLYLFCGRKCDRIKAILKESDGIVMIYKRLTAQGSYRWPRDKSEVRNLTCMKGGCAKTVTTYNLAYSLKELGKKVLCVDFDSQANLSICFGVENPVAVPVTIGHLMMAQIDDDELPGFKEYIQSRNGVDFISSSMMLSAVDAKLRLEMGAEKMLSEILEPLRDRYDVIIIDTAPTLGALNINALAAADEVIITVNP